MAKAQYRIVARQGDEQYLVILYGSDDKFGQIYDADSQDLLPPLSINSLFSKGTWEAIDDESQIPSSVKINIDYLIPEEQESPVTKGDLPGHEFRGNQYTGGRGGAGETHGSGHFLPLKSTEVVEKLGNKSILGGIQNTGFTKVKLADGSIGIIKHGMKQEEADGEVLSAKIGQALDVPIRDAVIIKTTTAGGVTRCDVLSPFIDGKTLNETSRRSDPDSVSPDLLVAQIPNATTKTENDYAKLQMLDEVIGNPDRNGGNVMVVGDTKSEPWNSPTDPHIIGIDHGMSFSYDPYASEIVFGLEQAGYTDAQVQQADQKMQAIASDATVPASLQDRFLNGVLPAWTEAVQLYKSRK